MIELNNISLAVVDDHKLFRKGLIQLIQLACGEGVKIEFEADNGITLKDKIKQHGTPDIILVDVEMPDMDGFESVEWLINNDINTKILVVSMVEKEQSIVQMIKLGVKGFLSKDVEPDELAKAITAIINNGYYYTDFITGKLIHSIKNEDKESLNELKEREIDFLRYSCSEMTYSEIAQKMFLSPKTIDGYRAALFKKLSVKSRVGLVLYAVKNRLIKL